MEKSEGREDRQHWTSYISSQLHTLILAFVNNPYLGIDSREQLAEEIGVPESRVHIWFQNWRSRLCVQRNKEPDEPLEQKQNQELATVPEDSSVHGLPLPTTIPISSPETPWECIETMHSSNPLTKNCLISLKPEQDRASDTSMYLMFLLLLFCWSSKSLSLLGKKPF